MNNKVILLLRMVLVGAFLLSLVFITSRFVGLAATNGILLWVAPILPLFPIIGMMWLRPREELAGWVLFTIWLGSTYATIGTPVELTVFGLIVLLAIGGELLSPWLFVVAWFGHIIWDFFPRQLPEMLHDLPIACMFFDGLIGLYIVWRILYSGKAFKSIFSFRPRNNVGVDTA